ncbi:NADH ubiquinone oxidoreductase subunit NDUFA12 [Colletotrichum graminicola]|uniref:NADH dehydrogenase [ubiquinone] 1 alpha subcomplex subunit n=1 Tax=Colletotrichum graminicola (strain M1.001 / M2 / FGSC 10212) TaxID=645133 RepID=E3QG45_COLGM|nr:NADH ubiquinone oxidoreductase subunit NDUFA12 [Colletotrichum graminicola M1.001]EFQ29880.1 NADH ubiquinone oxidoreductase subunit NDUFA12 [Colletotrichum graminicola M1.001]WDK12293.1 NADH ubiquinone oxidoreductase subunit NDUFA12 [Colletotrichum graminicola]
MSTPARTFNNLRKIGIKEYFRQMLYIGDTKHGRLVGEDKAGNKFFENNDELPLRTRWVDFKKHDYDSAQVEPGWHAWLAYMVDKPPTEDALLHTKTRKWEAPHVLPNFTATRGAFKTYNTTKPKVFTWEPKAIERQ